MSTKMQTKVQASPVQSFTPVQTGLLQRQCTLCNTPGLVEDSKQDKEKLTLQRSSADQAGTTSVPRFGHDFSRVNVHSKGMIQAKLKINEPGDIYEQEADRVADAVLRMPEPGVQRQVEPEEEETLQAKPLAEQITPLVQRQVEPEEEEEEPIQTKALSEQITPLVQRQEEEVQPKPIAEQITPLIQRQVDPEEGEEEPIQAKGNSPSTAVATPSIESSINSLKGSGQPLPESVRNYFEPRFGYDFSGVRVHTGVKANDTARAVNSRALTFGKNIVFNRGSYSPETREGKKLLAHELTHVVQQRGRLTDGMRISRTNKCQGDNLGNVLFRTPAGSRRTRRRSTNKIMVYKRGNLLIFRLFDFGIKQHKLKPAHVAFLSKISAIIKRMEILVYIIGHTSRSGPAGANKKLSLNRALRVDWHLIKYGVRSHQLRMQGKGESDAAKRGVPDGKESKYDRAVEVVLFLRSRFI